MAATATLWKGVWKAPTGWNLVSVEPTHSGVVLLGANNYTYPSDESVYKIAYHPKDKAYCSVSLWNKGKPKWTYLNSGSNTAKKIVTSYDQWMVSQGESHSQSDDTELPYVSSNHVLIVADESGADGYVYIKTHEPDTWHAGKPHDAYTHAATFYYGADENALNWIGGKYLSGGDIPSQWPKFGKDINTTYMWAAYQEWKNACEPKNGLPFTHEETGVRIDFYHYDGTDWHVTAMPLNATKAKNFTFYASETEEPYVPGVRATGAGINIKLPFMKDSLFGSIWAASKAYVETQKESAEEPTLDDLVKAAEDVKDSTIDLKWASMKMGVTEAYLGQVRCFAAFHDLSTVEAWKAIGSKGKCKVPAHDFPNPDDFSTVNWSDLRQSVADKEHFLGPDGLCAVCLTEAMAADGKLPEKVKAYVAFAKEESIVGLKANLEEAKIIRRQVSAFAHFHGWNRHKAVEKIKEAGEKAAYLLPYLFPAEKDAAPPDYYKLKSTVFLDISVALKGSKFKCTCNHCQQNKEKIVSWFEKGKNLGKLEFPDHQKYYKKMAPSQGDPIDPLSLLGGTPEYTSYEISLKKTVKNTECFLNAYDFTMEFSAFAAWHGISRNDALKYLPLSWAEKFPAIIKSFTSDKEPIPISLYAEVTYPHVAMAVGCICPMCKGQVKMLTTKAKKAVAAKKPPTKKAVAEAESAFSLALGEGLEAVALSAPPLEDQITAYAAYHNAYEWAIFAQAFPDQLNLFSKDDPKPTISDLTFHQWPDLLGKFLEEYECCDECDSQWESKNNDEPVSVVGPALTYGDIAEKSLKGENDMAKTETQETEEVNLKPGDQVVMAVKDECTLTFPKGQYVVISKS